MNLQLFHKKKDYVLMHRKTPVLLFRMDIIDCTILSIDEIYNPLHLPSGIQKGGRIQPRLLEKWMKDRMIPENADGYHETMKALGIGNRNDLLFKAYGISLCDTYWFLEKGQKVNWISISPYHHEYDLTSFMKARFFTEPQIPSASLSPSIMLSGYRKKSWINENGSFLLYKGSDDPYSMDPIHHWLAGRIAQLLDLHTCHYEVRVEHDTLISAVPAFTKEHTDTLSMQSILSSISSRPYALSFDSILHTLQEHGIKDAKKKISDMLLLDYLLMKPDRTLSDMAVLIDARNGSWIDIAPSFSYSHTLGSLIDEKKLNEYEQTAKCQLFNASSLPFESMLPYIDFSEYDLNLLKQIPIEYGNRLVEFQQVTDISSQRIEVQYILLYKRIRAILKAARMQKNISR